MEFKGYKLKNRRVFVSIAKSEEDNQDALFILFKRLAKDNDEINKFISNPTCSMTIEKRIVTTSLNISLETAYYLMELIRKSLEEYAQNNLQNKG